jgi:hypothetical protein
MRTDIPVPPEQVYQEESETESEPIGGRACLPHRQGSIALEEGGRVFPPRRRGPDLDPHSALQRHITHCSICNHPERDAIDEAILHWHSPTAIAFEFDLGDRRILYRHAHALGLFRQRLENTRHALGFLIEQAQSVVPTADAIIRAVRALACLDERGHWHEPRKEVLIIHRYEDATSRPRHEGKDNPPAHGSEPARQGDVARRVRTAPQSRESVAAHPPQPERSRWSPLRLFSTRLLRKAADPARIGVPSDQREPRDLSHSKAASGRFVLDLFSTRVLRKAPRNSNPMNKTAKTSRHVFAWC